MKDNRLYLVHIQECIAKIEEFTKNGKAEYLSDLKTQDAVIRNLQTLCESTQRIPEAWKTAHPEMDWKKMAGFRNVLTHQYLDIDIELVWTIVENYLPNLKVTIEAIRQEFWNA